ncbi:Dynactin subunit 2 [Golovinomyces cichoracearum]|uniref:Dynactin subunit 2 n=1 Tax=Golovinomyces cichoracearum TaxID=62708 RepID=A0A420I5B4_9PEZI|nr:Dynactin subunit 2 [Golovinomyces cichoracearum]
MIQLQFVHANGFPTLSTMAVQLSRKYANLPDLDSAPDVYETPELTDDNSTTVGRTRSESNASSTKDFGSTDNEKSGISRSKLSPNEARLHFAPSIIDAENVDFSDRVTAKRKSYKVSSNRRGRTEANAQKYGDFSDEESESLVTKIARLKREIEEVKEWSLRQAEKENTAEANFGDHESDVSALSRVLNEISIQQRAGNQSMGGKLTKTLGTGIKLSGPPQGSQNATDSATYTVTYAPTYQQSHALSKAADFDSRLASLEKALGITPTELSSLIINGSQKAVLPTIEKLQRQISVLSQSTPSLDLMGRQIRNLTQEAEKLEDVRKASKLTQKIPRNIEEDFVLESGIVTDLESGENPNLVEKVNALYGALPAIERLGPLLPSLLDRLSSLRAIHADAATTKSALDQIDKEQSIISEEIKIWKDGLSKVEKTMSEAETTTNCNMRTMEDLVKTLEDKVGLL